MPFSRFKNIFLLCASALSVVFVTLFFQSSGLAVYALDVGQGDAIFIETPNKTQILIDGGPTSAVLSELPEVMPFFDRHIDLLVLTHPQEDHIYGLVEVLKRYRVGAVLFTGVIYPQGSYTEFKRVLVEKQIPVYFARNGQTIDTGDGARLKVVYPFSTLAGQVISEADINDTSVGLVLSFGMKKFLFMGDATLKEEMELVNSGEDIDSDVLKLSHHGSKTSTSIPFLEKVTPEIAIASLGKNNRYGHPHKQVTDRLFNIPFYRTDSTGRVLIETDGKNIVVRTKR